MSRMGLVGPLLPLLLSLSGCSAHSLRVPEIGPIPNISTLVKVVKSRTDSLRDMRVSARVHLRIDNVKQKGSMVLFYRSPNRMKLDINDTLMGIGVMSAKANRDSIQVYLPRENRFLAGQTEETLYAITGVDLVPFDAYSAILGFPNLSDLDISRVTEFETRGDSLFVEVIAPLWTRHLLFYRLTATLLAERILSPGGLLLTQRLMSDYKTMSGVVLPGRIKILQNDARIELRVTERVINAKISESRFEMKVPSDVIPLGLRN